MMKALSPPAPCPPSRSPAQPRPIPAHPALPPASMWLARVTSLDQTSNCHLRSPRTPQCTRPLWMPTRMFTFTPVTSRTSLRTAPPPRHPGKHRGCASTRDGRSPSLPPKLGWHWGHASPGVGHRPPQGCSGTRDVPAPGMGATPVLCPTHEMASIMSTPISTQQCAWSPRASGSPDTQ